jgi:hypothetical protein
MLCPDPPPPHAPSVTGRCEHTVPVGGASDPGPPVEQAAGVHTRTDELQGGHWQDQALVLPAVVTAAPGPGPPLTDEVSGLVLGGESAPLCA